MFATLLPSFLDYYRTSTRNMAAESVIQEVLKGMEYAMTDHWTRSQCRVAPNDKTLSALINKGYVIKEKVEKSQWPIDIEYATSTGAPKVMRYLAVTLTLPNATQASSLLADMKGDGEVFELDVTGKQLTIKRPVRVIQKTWEHLYYNPQTGCME
ncbi:hypothetical protein [Photobacterium frigidiphilum]|nr:hypothetical protein [Photobacterium frigidiphilum]